MILYKFEASWCKPCRALTEMLKQAKLNMEMKVFDVDSPEGKDMYKKYSIRGVPTLIIADHTGLVIKRKTGVFKSLDDLNEFLN